MAEERHHGTRAKLTKEGDATVLNCQLYETAVARLQGNQWLGDEVIYAYLLLVTRNANVVVIDPLLTQTPPAFRIRLYPIRDKSCYVPLHLYRSHWALGVFDISVNTAYIYDSFAHRYNYSSSPFESNAFVSKLWNKITDVPLRQITVVGQDFVHEQSDGFNCGVFTCIYGERLASGVPTRSENPTRLFLQSARTSIERCLRSSFVVSETTVEGAAPLPRIYEYLLPTQYTLTFVNDFVDANNVDMSDALENSATSSLQSASKSIQNVPKIDAMTFEEIYFFHCINFCSVPNVLIVRTNLAEADVRRHSSALTKSLSSTIDRKRILILFYENRFGYTCAALFRFIRHRPEAIIFDFQLTALDAQTRKILRAVGSFYGFDNARTHLYFSCTPKTECKTTAAMSVSCFIQLFRTGKRYDVSLTDDQLRKHRKEIFQSLRLIPSLYACDYIPNVVIRMYLSHYFDGDEKVIFVDTYADGYMSNLRKKLISGNPSVELVILYSNQSGSLCGAVLHNKQRKSTGLIFDFVTNSIESASVSLLKQISALCGYQDCRFRLFCQPIFVFLHQSDFATAVGYCLIHSNEIMANLDRLFQNELMLFSKQIYSALFCKRKARATAETVDIKTVSPPIVNFEEEILSCTSMSKTSLHLGPMNVICEHCSAMSFRGETRLLCCNGGTCIVPEHVFSSKKDPSLNWLWLLAYNNEKLYSMLRAVNNLVAFAGLCMQIRKFNTSCGQIPLVVQGHINVGICHMNPDSNTASFAQLYICDDYKIRTSLSETMREWKIRVDYILIERIIATLKKVNVIARCYKSMYEVYLSEMKTFSESDAVIPPKVLMNLKHKRELSTEHKTTAHEGCLNIPRIDNQVAAIYVCRNGVMPSHEELDKGLRIWSRGGKSMTAHHDNNIDAMSYPLYFPRGEQSFVREALPKRRAKRAAYDDAFSTNASVSLDTPSMSFCNDDSNELEENSSSFKFLSRAQFYRFVFARRGDLLNHRFLGTGKLFSQFAIHVFSRIEADRLSSIGFNTAEIRSSKASSLYTYLDQCLHEKGLKLGRLINLPRTFIGSRSWYDLLYHNAMAVSQRLGKPDLFITFTGNQDWPEIRENLVTHFDSWITDPLLCVRVFRLRFQNFINELLHKQIFGEIIALQYSIEFQKRGMPHAHVLITLREKLKTPQQIDKIISAEIPQYPKKDDPERAEKLLLHTLVSRFMVHGPCKHRSDLACRSKNPAFCDKRFPKPFREQTELAEDGYPLYRRMNDHRSVAVGKQRTSEATNQDVIPYNPYLLLRYQCHINVESCCSIQAFKYIFKYIYKGADQVVFELLRSDQPLQQTATGKNVGDIVDIDMRKTYLDARYLSHVESAYRLLEFPLQFNMHTVFTLNPHLPGEEPVYFRGLPQRKIVPTSKLLAYFAVVKKCARAEHMTWIEVAENFRFNGKEYVEFKRSGCRISCLGFVSPKLRELYALRKLLYHVRGASSYEFLRTVDGKVYDTFMSAAEAAGLIETEKEWEECLRTASVTKMPVAIRRLYAQILLFCRPTNPVELWELFKQAMRPRNCRTDESVTLQDLRSISHIGSILDRNGVSLQDFGLQAIKNKLLNISGSNEAFERASPDSCMHEDLPMLTPAQQHIVDSIVKAANESKTSLVNKLFYIDGKAGCGKTFVLNALIRSLEDSGKKVISTASTGIAATLLKHGRTAHSLFCLPLKLHATSTANIDASSATGQALNAVDVIVWDEISMQSRYVVECVERLLRDVASPSASQHLFGGVTIVLGGDWCQFLPVIQGGTRQETVDITFKRSYLWKFFTTFTLHQNLRLINDSHEHADWLLSVGLGNNFCDDDNILLPATICMKSELDVINWMYTSDTIQNSATLARMALLTVRNSDAEELNLKVLEKLPGASVDFVSIDRAASAEENGINGLPCDNDEYFYKLMPSSLPPHILRLKPGAIVMLLRNLDVSAQLCNGTRLLLNSILSDKLLYCTNLTNGTPAFISRLNMDYSDSRTGIAFRRLQFPIRLSFCMTINKSQGQTFDKVGVILRTPSFAHGSTYVALSRCTNVEGLKVTRNWMDGVPILPKIRNVIYDEII